MKYLRVTALLSLAMLAQPVFADDEHSLLSGDTENYLGYGLIVTMFLLFIIAMMVTLRALKVLTRILLKSQGASDEEVAAELNPAKNKETKRRGEVWEKILSLKPLSEEKDLLIEHEYDGIQELNNPTPAWFMYLFYGTIIFAIGYLLNYHVFMTGQLQYDEYKTEMAQADADHQLYLSKAANRVDENTVKLVNNPAVIASGQAIFKTNCVVCHGDHGQGGVGPNLTDDYWLHGSKINDLFKTVKYGVLTKGMPTWEKVLSAKQISDVVNYVKTLHGTNPANPKAPQGVLEADGDKKLASN